MFATTKRQADASVSSHWSPRLQRVRAALACPSCRADLVASSDAVICARCHKRYPVRAGKIHFVDSILPVDALDTLKRWLKQWFGRAYYSIGIAIVAPTYPFSFRKAIRQHCRPDCELVIDLGSGNNRLDDDIITLDAVDYSAVDIVADLARLPFKSDSIDAFASRSVLEHLPDLNSAVRELARCTRSGGIGLHLIPFLFPYHASPHDYQRLTHTGAAMLFPGWEIVEQRNATGPVTLCVVCLAEFLAILLSLGFEQMKAAAYLLACLLLFPIKFLDAPFVGRRAFLGLAPTILTVARKP
jgi:SAM-dependent methyltransferase